jgi:hypothetical protein
MSAVRVRVSILVAFALAVVVGCGGRTSSSAPSNRAAPPEATPTDAAPSAESCYPYAMREGACLTTCDWSKPHEEQGCAKDTWPLNCNSDGTCTPEQRHDH